MLPTFPGMAQEDGERAAFRVRLGMNLQRVRRRYTTYTQATIAAKLGVNPDTVGSWEKGDTEPQAWELAEMIRRYKVPCEWLVDPTASVTLLDRRIAQLRRAASEAARDDVEGEPGRPDDDEPEPRPGRRLS